MRSDLACVAGIARTRRAARARYGNSVVVHRLYHAFGVRLLVEHHHPTGLPESEHLEPYGVNNATLEAVGRRVAITAAR